MKKHQTQQDYNPGRGRFAARLAVAIAFALCTAGANAQTPIFSKSWDVPAGTYPGMPANNGNNYRGVAISPVTTNVLYASTTGGTNNGVNHVGTLDYANGSNYLANLSGSGIAGGSPVLIATRVADDGAVYACNLSGAPASNFKIYKWASELDTTNAPLVVFETGAGNSFQWRIGDFMDVRGSGINTEIVAVGNGSGVNATTNFVIFRPTDSFATNFTNFSITIPGAPTVFCGRGVAFEGTNNAIYVSNGSQVRRVAYNPVTLTAVNTRTNGIAGVSLDYYTPTNGIELLATVSANSGNGVAQIARIYQIPASTTAALTLVLNSNMPAVTGSVNANAIGQVDAVNGHFAFGAPGHGVTLFKFGGVIFTNPPAVSPIAGGGSYIEGYPVNLSASASGPAPLSYQWYFNTNSPLLGATTNTYSIPSVTPADAGLYSLVVSNPFGVVTSSFAGLTVLPGNFSNFATNLWTLAPGSRPYLTTGDTQRGLAYDAVSNVVVLVSRSPSNAVYLLDAATGADVGNLDVSAIFAATPPGTFPINLVGVADDGAVYVGNLIISGASDNFSLYRWQNADPLASPSQAYFGNPGITRIGDTMAVRGAGVSTEILCSFRTGTNVALFTTGDGFNFTPTVIPVTNLPADAVANGFAGLGLAFGPGNTFWAKSSGFNLRQVAIDTNTMTAQVVATYTNLPISEAPLGADNVNGFIATVAFGQIPQNLSIWDVSRGEPDAVQLDRELFGSNNANVNGTGAVAVDVAGGRIFALDSNNGIIALAYAPRLNIDPTPAGGILTWTGPGTLQASTNLASGVWTDLPAATSPHTNTAAKEVFFRVKR